MSTRPTDSPPHPTAAPDLPLSFRPVQAWDEYLAAEELQRIVWQMPDWRDSVPANLLITVAKNGGCVLGAFDQDRLVGLAFSFIGLDSHFNPPILKHCSHMLAVLPEYQSRRIGIELKLRQREFSLNQNITLMTWTFDPLLSLNANLNVSRLGAIARRYVPSAYGEMTDGLNAGLPSDRFEVEWWLASPRVRARLSGPPRRTNWETLVRQGAREALQVSRADRPFTYVNGQNDLDGDVLLVEIPADLAALKAAAPERARDWRMHTRECFQRAFAAGYAATNFIFDRSGPAPRAAYVLTRAESLEG